MSVAGGSEGERTVTIVGVDEAHMRMGKIGLTAPIATALIKARAGCGDEVAVHTPRGVEIVEVLSVSYPSPAARYEYAETMRPVMQIYLAHDFFSPVSGCLPRVAEVRRRRTLDRLVKRDNCFIGHRGSFVWPRPFNHSQCPQALVPAGSEMMSPKSTPTRNHILRSSGQPWFSLAIASWMVTAHLTASDMLSNVISSESPAVCTRLP